MLCITGGVRRGPLISRTPGTVLAVLQQPVTLQVLVGVCWCRGWSALALALAIYPVWLALVLAMLLVGSVLSNNDVGFDSDTDDDE